jgi:NADP-dependent 3-hydroxy acid dehydrogenase YdfG
MKKTIAVVGAGPGIGMAVAQRFGREGFNVALIARNSEALQSLVRKLEETSVEAAAFQADVLDRPGLISALEKVTARFGSIDVLEYGPTPPFDSMRGPRDLDIENEQYHLDLQVLGAIAAVRTVLPGMLANKAGSLLFTTAASAQYPTAVTASFGVAAGALLNYVRLLHKDLAPTGVYAGMVSIAGLVVPPGKDLAEAASDFPPGIPLLDAADVAELHWNLHSDRQSPEVFAGDIKALLANPHLY